MRRLFSANLPIFARRIVLVPSEPMKNFLLFRFANNPRLQIAAGVQIFTLAPGMLELFSLGGKDRIPTFLELALHIECEIYALLQDKEQAAPLLRFLEAAPEFSEKSARRLRGLSQQLSLSFLKMAVSGGDFLKEWQEKNGWQQFIWQKVFGKNFPWKTPNELLAVHLFGFNFLPKPYLHFFRGGVFYQFSPCQLFWEDLYGDREQISLDRLLRKKGVKESDREQLEGYLKDRHPLLANWGRLGREHLKNQELLNPNTNEYYSCQGEYPFESILQAVRSGILCNECSEEKLALPAFSEDASLHLHSAPTKLREVESLKEVISSLIVKSREGNGLIEADDILVLAPDINEYAPYIHMVFGAPDSPFDYGIDGLTACSQNQFMQAFRHFLSLFEQRFEAASVLKLFSFQAFLEKFAFSVEDIALIENWIEKAEIRWGVDAEQKREILGGLQHDPLSGTWELGIDRLIWGLALSLDESDALEFDGNIWPCLGPALSEAELLGRVVFLLRSIKEDLQFLCFPNRRPLQEWISYVRRLAEKYFSKDPNQEAFFQKLENLIKNLAHLTERPLYFESINGVLEHFFNAPSGSFHASHLQKINFTSLREGALIPAKVIWLLGMEEGSFPKEERPGNLCEMPPGKGDWHPGGAEEARYNFLQALFSAKEHFCLSYTRQDPRDNKEIAPSAIVQELFSFLDRRFINFDGAAPSKCLTYHHPTLSFDKSYFLPNARVRSCSETQYRAAASHFLQPKHALPAFLGPEKFVEAEGVAKLQFGAKSALFAIPSLPEIVVPIKKLSALARNPVKFYFNETLQIYLKSKDGGESGEFLISALDRAILRSAAIRKSLPAVLRAAEKKGKLSFGLFQELAIHKSSEDFFELQKNLTLLGVKIDELFSVELKADQQQIEQTGERRFAAPAIKVSLPEGRTAHLIGKLDNLSAQGWLFEGEDEIPDLLKAWPQYLVVAQLKNTGVDVQPRILLAKDGKVKNFADADTLELLQNYIIYYERSLQEMSPLMPQWAEAFLCESAESLQKVIDDLVDGTFYQDDYLNWLNQREVDFSAEELFEKWAVYFRNLLKPLFHLKTGSCDALI